MKKYVLLAALFVTLAIPAVAWSQGMPGGNNGGGMQPPSGGQNAGQHDQGDGQHFQERKAEILKHLNEHLAEVQQRISCVQSASDHTALRSCMPMQRGGGERHGMMEHGSGQGQGPGEGGGQEPGQGGPDGGDR